MKSNAQNNFFKEGKTHEGKENHQYCDGSYRYGRFSGMRKFIFSRILVGYAGIFKSESDYRHCIRRKHRKQG